MSYAGLAPGRSGVYQINVRAPAKPPVGTEVALTITQGGVTAIGDGQGSGLRRIACIHEKSF